MSRHRAAPPPPPPPRQQLCIAARGRARGTTESPPRPPRRPLRRAAHAAARRATRTRLRSARGWGEGGSAPRLSACARSGAHPRASAPRAIPHPRTRTWSPPSVRTCAHTSPTRGGIRAKHSRISPHIVKDACRRSSRFETDLRDWPRICISRMRRAHEKWLFATDRTPFSMSRASASGTPSPSPAQACVGEAVAVRVCACGGREAVVRQRRLRTPLAPPPSVRTPTTATASM